MALESAFCVRKSIVGFSKPSKPSKPSIHLISEEIVVVIIMTEDIWISKAAPILGAR